MRTVGMAVSRNELQPRLAQSICHNTPSAFRLISCYFDNAASPKSKPSQDRDVGRREQKLYEDGTAPSLSSTKFILISQQSYL